MTANAAFAAPVQKLKDRDGDRNWHYACIGDSNTWERGGAEPVVSWCSLLLNEVPSVGAVHNTKRYTAPTVKTNAAVFGATACIPPPGWPWPIDGTTQLDRMITNRTDIDAALIALGTNDVGTRNAKKIQRCITALTTKAKAAKFRVFVATIPPQVRFDGRGPEINANIDKVNKWIRKTYAGSFMEFHDGFEGMFRDSLHFNAAGQALASQRAAATIRAATK